MVKIKVFRKSVNKNLIIGIVILIILLLVIINFTGYDSEDRMEGVLLSGKLESNGDDNLIAYYDFERDTTLSDRFLSKYKDGRPILQRLKGDVEFVDSFHEYYGRAVRLDQSTGKNDVLRILNSHLRRTPIKDELSIAFWVKTGSDTDMTLFKKKTSGRRRTGQPGFQLKLNKNTLEWFAGGLGSSENLATYEGDFSDWNYIVVTAKMGGDKVVYVNGLERARVPSGTKGLNVRDNLFIGINKGFTGQLDELKIWNRELSADEVSEKSEGYGANDAIYECPGSVVNSVCHVGYRSLPIEKFTSKEFENGLKVTLNYPLETNIKENFDFSMELENLLDSPLTIQYTYYFSDNVEVVSLDEINGEIPADKGREVTISSHSSKTLSATLSPLEYSYMSTIISPPFFRFQMPEFENIEAHYLSYPQEGLNCGEKIFPPQNTPGTCFHPTGTCAVSNRYDESMCCGDVFYPGFQCCSNSDCDIGSCVDGRCIEKMFPVNIKNPAKGNKKILVVKIIEGTTDPDCNNRANDIIEITNFVEDFYDLMANIYMQENNNFINFRWDYYDPIPLSSEEMSNLNNLEKINLASEKCDIDIDDYSELYLIGLNLGVLGRAGRPIKQESFRKLTTVHEIGHNFGCADIYNGVTAAGAQLQWADSLHGGFHNSEQLDLARLQICRGEMGYADLNRDGIYEINQYEWEPDDLIMELDTSFSINDKGVGKIDISNVEFRAVKNGEYVNNFIWESNSIDYYIEELDLSGTFVLSNFGNIIELPENYIDYEFLTIVFKSKKHYRWFDDDWILHKFLPQKTVVFNIGG